MEHGTFATVLRCSPSKDLDSRWTTQGWTEMLLEFHGENKKGLHLPAVEKEQKKEMSSANCRRRVELLQGNYS
jgi:hypothetical protein